MTARNRKHPVTIFAVRRLFAALVVAGFLTTGSTFVPSVRGMGSPPRSSPTDGFIVPPEPVLVDNRPGIRFAVSEPGPVSVHIENERGRIVRHLASGMLGENAPEPLEPDRLTQTLVWDGACDAGLPVPPGPYAAVVELGLKATFERVIGEQPNWLGNIHAIAADPQGTVFLAVSEGGRLAAHAGVIALDRDGNYLRQISPPSHSLQPEDLPGLVPVRMPDGSVWYPRGLDTYGGHIQLDLPAGNIGSMAVSSRGELLIPGPPGNTRRLLRLRTDGHVPAGAFSTRLTPLPDAGRLSVAVCPAGDTLYVSGAEAGFIKSNARVVVDRHAVYRLRLDHPGPPEIFTGDDENRGGPGFRVNQPRGLATDAEGRLYVCNYGGHFIAVYTPGGGLLRSIAVDHPQQVAVDSASGRIYVLAGREEGSREGGRELAPAMKEARLLRFSPEGEKELETTLEHPFLRMETTQRPGPYYRLVMALETSGPRPVIWVGLSAPDARHARWRLLHIQDLGHRFGEHRELNPIPPQGVSPIPLHLIHDAEDDSLYVNHLQRLIRYAGDGQTMDAVPLISIEDEEPFHIVEAALGPDRTIYALTWDGGREDGWRRVRLRRFRLDGRQIPFEGGRLESETIARVMKKDTGLGSRGLTVAADGRIHVMYYDLDRPAETIARWERGGPLGTAVAAFNPDGSLEDSRRIAHLSAGATGIRADRQGNLYIGESMLPIGVTYPRDFAAVLPDPLERPYPALTEEGRFDPMLRWQGSLLSFGPQGGEAIGLPENAVGFLQPERPARDLWHPAPDLFWCLHTHHRLRVTGTRWLHHGVFSPIPTAYRGVPSTERCVCSGGRFDIDPFNRIVVPDRIRHRVTMLDSAGNVMAQWGQRGNRDSTSRGSELFLVDPWWIATSRTHLHIGEKNPVRIQRWRITPVASARIKFPENTLPQSLEP